MSELRSHAFKPTPEQMALLAGKADTARQIGAHAAAFLDGADPELSRRLTPDSRLEDTIPSDPPRSVVSEAAAILDQLNDGLNPSDRETADAALALAILARCQSLMDTAKARLQP